MVKSKPASNPLSKALTGMDRASLRSFLEQVREVSEHPREVLGALRPALEAGDDAASLRLARELVVHGASSPTTIE
jgi:hypothetical protein